MKEQLEKIRQEALDALSKASDTNELDALRVRFLGKKGELTAVLKSMGKLSAEERPAMGQAANNVRAAIEEKLEEAKTALKIRVRLILDRPGSIDHDQMGKPVRHALDDGRVLIGIVTSALQIIGDRIALRGILLHKGLAFRRIRLDSGDHFRAAGFIEIKAVVVDADVVQIAELLPG